MKAQNVICLIIMVVTMLTMTVMKFTIIIIVDLFMIM